MRLRYKGFSAAWWLIFLEALTVFGAGFFQLWLTENYIMDTYPAMTVSQLFIFIPIAAGLIYLKNTHGYAPLSALIGLRSFDPVMMLLLLVLPSATQYFAAYMQWPYMEALIEIFGQQVDLNSPETVSELLWLFLSLCILAPVFEELLFRGIIIKILEPYGTLTAVFSTALGFAILHFSPAAFFTIFAVGAVLGFVRLYSGSVFSCMLFHSIFNFGSVIQLVFQNQLEKYGLISGIYSVFMACLFPVLIFIMYRSYGRGKWYRGTIRGCRGGAVPIILLSVLFVLTSLSLAIDSGYIRLPLQDKRDYFYEEEEAPEYYDSDDFFNEFFRDFYNELPDGYGTEGGESQQ
ncbi:MAG: CPBP family intramembrane metalloprotease [Clostridia bacterium]|nr:CPBP family intramembrane metalloprotease [Clostridia bacterium]